MPNVGSWLKDPDAVLDYMIDWEDWLGTEDIATSTWIPDAGITVDSDTNTAKTTTVWLKGGTADVTYGIINRITTATRTEDRPIIIIVTELPATMYASVRLLRAHIDKTSEEDDTILYQVLMAATINIDRVIGRYRAGFTYFNAPAVGSTLTYVGDATGWLRIDPNIATSLVEVKTSYSAAAYTPWTAADWIACTGHRNSPRYGVLPYRAIIVAPAGNYSVFTDGHGYPTVRVTAQWGFSATPPGDIVEATIMQAARWYKRLQSGMSDVLASEELGMLLYQKALDPDVRRILIDGGYIESGVLGF